MFMLEETLRNEMMENRKLGREEGIRNGIKRGKEEAKLQMIKRMKKLGFDLKQISQITGIREEEIEKILFKNIADEDLKTKHNTWITWKMCYNRCTLKFEREYYNECT